MVQVINLIVSAACSVVLEKVLFLTKKHLMKIYAEVALMRHFCRIYVYLPKHNIRNVNGFACLCGNAECDI